MAQEANETKTVKFDDKEYVVTKFVLEDLDALEAFEDGKYSKFVRHVLGAKQYAEFRKDHKASIDLYNLAGALLGDDDEETEDKE